MKLGEFLAGHSHCERKIEVLRYGTGQLSILMLGGVHGDEVEGIHFVERFVKELDKGTVSLPKRSRCTFARGRIRTSLPRQSPHESQKRRPEPKSAHKRLDGRIFQSAFLPRRSCWQRTRKPGHSGNAARMQTCSHPVHALL